MVINPLSNGPSYDIGVFGTLTLDGCNNASDMITWHSVNTCYVIKCKLFDIMYDWNIFLPDLVSESNLWSGIEYTFFDLFILDVDCLSSFLSVLFSLYVV